MKAISSAIVFVLKFVFFFVGFLHTPDSIVFYFVQLNGEEQKQIFLSLPSPVKYLKEFNEQHKDFIECIFNLKSQFLQQKFPFLVKDWGFFGAASVLLVITVQLF